MKKIVNTYGYLTLLMLFCIPVVIAGAASAVSMSSKSIQTLLFSSWSLTCFLGAQAVQKHAPYTWKNMPFWGFGFATRRTLIGMYSAAGICAVFFIMSMFL